ncbi:hypothetical protein [Streptomyces sp. NPDC002104]
MTVPPLSITPGVGFLAGVTFTHGMHYPTDSGPVAQVLLTHAPPRRAGETLETIEAGMRALSFCLSLGPVEEEPRYVGARISLHRGIASLDYGDDRWVLRIPATGREWQRHVALGGPVRLTLSFTPTPAGRTQTDLSQFIEQGIAAGLVRWATTDARRRW